MNAPFGAMESVWPLIVVTVIPVPAAPINWKVPTAEFDREYTDVGCILTGKENENHVFVVLTPTPIFPNAE
jgi:hypothetical protein